MTAPDALAIFRPKVKLIAPRWASLFGLRYMLDRYGYDPCDEWDIDTVLGLPDGLTYREGKVMASCVSCDRYYEWPVDVSEFDPDDDSGNLCGGSPWCCP